MKVFVLAAAAVATLCLVGLTTAPHSAPVQSIDAIIGEGRFNAVFPVTPGSRADLHRQITERLVKLESLLRSRDVSDWSADLQAERARSLDHLHDYRMQGAYTTNYDRPGEPLPCFMDRDGNYCAVAWLIAESGELPLAKDLNSRYQYATIAEMKSPELDRWIEHSGLTRAEVITIQVREMEFEPVQAFSIRGGDSLNVLRRSDSVATPPAVPGSTPSPDLSLTSRTRTGTSLSDLLPAAPASNFQTYARARHPR